MAPPNSSSTEIRGSKSAGGLRQGTLSFTSAKRSGSSIAKDGLKGKAPAAEPATVTPIPIRVGGKRKYEPDPEPEHEKVKKTTDALERESLVTENPRWNKAYGLAREKMGNIQPGPSSRSSSKCLLFADMECVHGVVHAKDQSPVHHILRVFDLYVAIMCSLGSC
jgi:DNA polymerase delta subunit 4